MIKLIELMKRKEGMTHEEFMDYWVPRLEHDRYNLIHFEGAAYERAARLDVTPRPDTTIRVFMAFAPLSENWRNSAKPRACSASSRQWSARRPKGTISPPPLPAG